MTTRFSEPLASDRADAAAPETDTPDQAPTGARPSEAPTLRALAAVLAYNNGENIARTLARVPAERDFDVLVVDDGSTDSTPQHIARFAFPVLTHPHNAGIGAAIKSAVRYARARGYDIICILAGNTKDDPAEIPKLLAPIRADVADYVQGSRFAPGGADINTPHFRQLIVQLHARMFGLLTGFPATDALNGFRAYRLSIFDDPEIDIWQDWLDRYEYETYLHYKALSRKRVAEVGVKKTYPPRGSGIPYSHIRPIIDWWKILRPLPFLLFRLRK